MKDFATSIAGVIVYIAVIFAVLFDPTQLALGSQLVTLPAGLLVLAEGLGNILWFVGVLFLALTAIATIMWLSDEAFEKFIANVTESNTFHKYKPKWHKLPRAAVSLVMSFTALASGFWFTGFFWVIAMFSWSAFVRKIRTTDEYKEAIASA